MTAFHSIQKKVAGGFALLEVVIAMFVLAIGILGAGALQTASMQSTQGAYWRSQAMFLAGDMLNRMRANRTVASSYVGSTDSVTGNKCIEADTGCTPAALAADDLRDWAEMMQDSKLPNGVGTISSTSPNNYRIRITWDENEWQAGQYARTTDQKIYDLNVALDYH